MLKESLKLLIMLPRSRVGKKKLLETKTALQLEVAKAFDGGF